MSTRLIVSDIHINDFSRCNYTPGARLEQFTKLADRLVELGLEHGAIEIDIAGDIIDKPVMRPYILKVAHNFLRTLSNNFQRVNYILGQHDFDTKSQNHWPEDSVVNLFDFPNVYYMNKSEYIWEGLRLGYMDWYPRQDLSWIGDKLDVFIGHVTVDERFGQEIDTSKFNIAIVGDIHQHKKVGNMHCIGVPLQHNMGDQRAGTVMILDSNNPTKPKWIETDPDYTRFLRMEYTQSEDVTQHGFVSELQYNVYRPVAVSKNGSRRIDSTNIDVEGIIAEHVKLAELNDVHNRVLAAAKDTVTPEIDFDFKLLKLYIKNYRSISELDYTFSEGIRNFKIYGVNGSGKSSFILAIFKSLVTDRSLGQSIRKGESEMIIRLTLEYEGVEYEITRGTKWGLKVNGVELSFNNKSQFEAEVRSRLPFTEYHDSFFFNYWNVEILSGINNQRRVELLTKYNRLNILDNYNLAAIKEIEGLNTQIADKRKLLIDLRARAELREQDILKCQTELAELEAEYNLPWTLEEVNLKLVKYDEYIELRSKLNKMNSEIEFFESKLDPSYPKEDPIDPEQTKAILAEIDTLRDYILKILELETEEHKLEHDYSYWKSKWADCTKSLSKLDPNQGNIRHCPTCNSELEDKVAEDLIETYRRSRDEAEVKFESCSKELQEIRDKISKIGEKSEITAKIKELEGVVEKNKRKSSEIAKFNEEQLAYRNKISYARDKMNLVEIPDDYEDVLNYDAPTLAAYKSQLKVINVTKSKLDDLTKNSFDSLINDAESELNDLLSTQSKLVKYRDLTSKRGDIYLGILRKIATDLTTDQFKFGVVSERASGTEYFDLNVSYKVGRDYLKYSDLSSGQKTLCDLYFISRMIKRGGIFVADEFLRFVDSENHDVASELIDQIDVNQVIMSSHSDSLQLNNSATLMFSLDNQGVTNLIK